MSEANAIPTGEQSEPAYRLSEASAAPIGEQSEPILPYAARIAVPGDSGNCHA
jgi:hypothetical protein